MHPLFNSTNRILGLLLGWLLFSLALVYLVSEYTRANLIDCLFLFTPLYLLSLLFILPNFYVCQGLPLGQSSWSMIVASQALALIAAVVLWVLAADGYAVLLDNWIAEGRFTAINSEAMALNIGILVVQYDIFILLHYLYLAVERARNLEEAALKQKLLIAQAELQTLRATVHPHFLFNSLNTLANIALSSPDKAHRFCLLIAEFLRYSVAYSKKESASLQDELEHIQNYLGIERERFGDRLQTEFDIQDECRQVQLPSLILFPVVENAIKHGIDSCLEGGVLALSCRMKGSTLLVEVTNPVDELGRKQKGTGHGLSSVRQRLRTRYGAPQGESALVRCQQEAGKYTTRLYIPVEQEETGSD